MTRKTAHPDRTWTAPMKRYTLLLSGILLSTGLALAALHRPAQAEGDRSGERNGRAALRGRADFPARRSSTPQIVTTNLIGDYRFTAGSGTSVTDYSGAGNTGTFGTGRAAPTWVRGGGIHVAPGAYVSIPIKCSQALAVQVLHKQDTGTVRTYLPILGSDQNTWGLWIQNYFGSASSNVSVALFSPEIWSNGAKVTTLDLSAQNAPVVIAHTAPPTGSDQFYINGDTANQMSTSANTSTGRTGNLNIGFAPYYNGNGAVGYAGNIYRVLIYSTTLSAAQFAQNCAAIAAAAPAGVTLPGYNPSTARILASEGDSITNGVGLSGISNSWPLHMTLIYTYDRTNFGITGQTVATMLASGYNKIKYKYAPSGTKNVLTLMAGTNDLCVSPYSSPATTFANLQSLVNLYTAQGWKIVLVPMISRTGNGYGGSTCDSLMATYNALIWGASWPSNVSVIQANDAYMGSGSGFNFFASGSYSNTTYYQRDAAHPTQTGANAIGAAVAAYINALAFDSPSLDPDPSRRPILAFRPPTADAIPDRWRGRLAA